MKGLYLCSPHGSLIHEGRKTAIAIAAPLPITGHRVICSKEGGSGLAFGIALIGEPALLDVPSFTDREDEHCVPKSCRLKWWPDADHLYHYPILHWDPFPDPVEIEVLPGTTMDMGEVAFQVPFGMAKSQGSAQAEPPPQAGEDCSGPDSSFMSSSPNPPLTSPDELVISPESGKIMSTSPHQEREEIMPWKPSDATEHTKKADTPAKQKRWASVANSALKSCLSDGKETKFCEASAIKQANSVVAGMKGIEELVEQTVDAILPSEPEPETEVLGRDEVKQIVADTVRTILNEKADAAKVILDEKAGDLGLGAQGKLCTCPNCGFEVEGEAGVPCRTQECPKCGAKLQGGDGDDNESDETPEDSQPPKQEEGSGDQEQDEKPDQDQEEGSDKPEINQDEENPGNPDEEQEPVPNQEVDPEQPPTEEEPSATLTEFAVEKLRVIWQALSEFFKRETYQDKEPDVSTLYTAKGFKTLGKDSQGNTWFMLWPTNSYRDREGEIFASKALHDFVSRHAHQHPKGEAWYQHIQGSKFGTIWEQAVVADCFICQLGTYDNTPIGQAFKAFFEKHPDSHPTLAPHGWGASHQYDYIWEDRLDGVYEHFDIHESTVLPLHKAANVYNPTPKLGGMKMNDNEKTAFETIGQEVGVDDLVAQVTAAGQEAKAALDARQVERKSVEEPEPQETKEETPEGESQPEKDPKVPAVVASLAERPQSKSTEEETTTQPDAETQAPVEDVVSQVLEVLGAEELSKAFTDLTSSVQTLQSEVASIKSTLEVVTEEEEVKKAKIAETLPRYPHLAWLRASEAKETEVPDEVAASLKVKAAPANAVPDAVKNIASQIGVS